MHRHGRQMKLAEVGEAGQARIGRARVDVRADGLAGEVATRYLAGAGVAGMRVRSEHLASLVRSVDEAVDVEVTPALDRQDGGPCFYDLRDPSTRAVADGAMIALRALRLAIDGPP